MSISLFANRVSSTTVSCLSSLKSTRPAQEPVMDHMIFQAPRDPYQALTEASQRLNEGKSLFFPQDDEVEVKAEQGTVQRGGHIPQV